MAIVLGPNQYGKAETRVVRVYRDTARHEIRDLNVSHRAARRLRGRPRRRRPARRPADRHPEEHRLRVRQGEGRRRDRGVRADARRPLRRADAGRRRRPDRDRGVPLGADPGRRRRARPRVRPRGSGTRTTVVNVDGRGDDRTAHVVSGIRDLVVAEVDRLGVPRLPEGRVHDAAGDQRPDPRDVAGRPVALRPHRRRVGQVVRRDPRAAARAVRRDPQPRAAADPVRHGRGGAREPPGGRGDQVLRAEQAPLPRRPVAVRCREPERGVLSPPTGRTA